MNEDNKYDALKEIFSRKLANYHPLVDSSIWDVINKRLDRNHHNTKKIIIIWGSIAASVAIILAVTLLRYDRMLTPLSVNQNLTENTCEHLELHNETFAIVSDSINLKTNYSSRQIRHLYSYSSSIVHNDDNNNNIEKTNVEDTISFVESEKTFIAQKQQESSFSAKQTTRQHVIKEQKEWLLATVFHINDGIKTNTTLRSSTVLQTPPHYGVNTLRAAKIYEPGDEVFPENRALVPDNTVGEYLAPLSFGLSVRKNINKYWGIETGLVYTYLSSNYRWNESYPFEASQQLHYLGIPVNGVVYLWNNHPQWSVYFSAGAMLEKGLWMQTVRKQHLPDHVVTTTQKSYIDGWQWSLNSSIGISYLFADKMKLYLEPRLGYYFDSDQPVSIRTDRPISIGFGAGLQYSF